MHVCDYVIRCFQRPAASSAGDEEVSAESDSTLLHMLRCSLEMQVKRVVIIGTSVLFFGTNLSNKTKIGTGSAASMWALPLRY